MRSTIVSALILTATLGCQRLNIEHTVQVNPHEVKTLNFDAPRSEQKVSIAISASGAPVDAYLVLQKDAASVSEQLSNRQKPANVLSQSENSQQGTLEGVIPAKESFAVLLSQKGSGTVEVKVKAVSK